MFHQSVDSSTTARGKRLCGVALATTLVVLRCGNVAALTPTPTVPAGTIQQFYVDSSADLGDAAPDGLCADSNGDCTLRAAIQEANRTSARDIIRFDVDDVYLCSNDLPTRLEINQPVVIDGSRPGGTVRIRSVCDGDSVGLYITGGDSVVAYVSVVQFAYGIILDSDSNHVHSSFVGTTAALAPDLRVRTTGITVNGSFNVIGSPPGQDYGPNVIFPAPIAAVYVRGSDNVIANNHIGQRHASDGGAQGAGILLEATERNVIGPDNAICGVIDGLALIDSPHNEIAGNRVGVNADGERIANDGIGLFLSASNENVIGTHSTGSARNFIVASAEGVRFERSHGNQLIGNWIGMAPDQTAMGNEGAGVRLSGSNGNSIGGVLNQFSGNTVANNLGHGIALDGSFDNTVAANQVHDNALDGIYLNDSSVNRLGWTRSFLYNTIYSNGDSGIEIEGRSQDNIVSGNFVGGVGIGQVTGIKIDTPRAEEDATVGGSLIGGPRLEDGNVVLGNTTGLDVTGLAHIIEGNWIGFDPRVWQPVPNSTGLSAFGSGFTIGGAPVNGGERGNVVSGNWGAGMLLRLRSSLVQRNMVGATTDPAICAGNGGDGITMQFPSFVLSANVVGSTSPGFDNIVRCNFGAGIRVDFRENRIARNSIFGNGGLAVDLAPIGVLPNDPLDADNPSANAGQNYPDITSAIISAGATTISGNLHSSANSGFTVELFANPDCDPSGYGEAETFLGTTLVTTDASGNGAFTFQTSNTAAGLGRAITARATNTISQTNSANTSEMSACVTVATGVPPPTLTPTLTRTPTGPTRTATRTFTASRTDTPTLTPTPGATNASYECSVHAELAYPDMAPLQPTRRVQIRLSAGTGSDVRIHQARFDLACRDRACDSDLEMGCDSDEDCPSNEPCRSLLPRLCNPEVGALEYAGNLSTTCTSLEGNLEWNVSAEIGGVTFATANAAYRPADGSYCTIEFDVRQIGPPADDGTPQWIEQRVTIDQALCAVGDGLGAGAVATGRLAALPLPAPSTTPNLLTPTPTVATSSTGGCTTRVGIEYSPQGRVRLSFDVDQIATSFETLAVLPACRNRVCDLERTSCSTDVDCDTGSCTPILPECEVSPDLVYYGGDAAIASNCVGEAGAVDWSSNQSFGGSTAELILTASDAVQLGGSFPHSCYVELLLQTPGAATDDATPDLIEQVVSIPRLACDNGLVGSVEVSGAMPPVPTASVTATTKPTRTPTETPSQTSTATMTPTHTATSSVTRTPTFTHTPTPVVGTPPPPPPPPSRTSSPTRTPTPAGMFLVDSEEDEADATIDGICATATGACTLRAAIEESNATPAENTIRFAVSAVFICSNGGWSGGLPEITAPLKIDGNWGQGVPVRIHSLCDPYTAGLKITGGNSMIDFVAVLGFGPAIYLESDGNRVRRSRIGTVSGFEPYGTDGIGIFIDGDNNIVGNAAGESGAGNTVVATKGDAIVLDSGTGNVIAGNYLGRPTAAAVGLDIGNDGISLVDSSYNVLGPDNYINGAVTGIRLLESNFNTIIGNHLGTSASGDRLSNSGFGIELVDSDHNLIGSNGNNINRNDIGGGDLDGIRLYGSHFNEVLGNHIGLSRIPGTQTLIPHANGGAGVSLESSSGNAIGGVLNQSSGNRIAYNGRHGVELGPSGDNNTIAANDIFSNGVDGIHLIDSGNNLIGGSRELFYNRIYSNADDGIEVEGVSATNVIRGNFIGGSDVGQLVGIKVLAPPSSFQGTLPPSTIGGRFPGWGNVVVGNQVGMRIGGTDHVVEGNFVGWHPDLQQAIGNGFGMSLTGARHFVGGISDEPDDTPGNIVAGNTSIGILSYARFTTISGNQIGTVTQNGDTFCVPNGGAGVWLESTLNPSGAFTLVGGYGGTGGNTIRCNGGAGVRVEDFNQRITGNRIADNDGLGIDIAPDGVNTNDPLDADLGNNRGQNHPVLTSALLQNGVITVTGTLHSLPNRAFTIELFANSTCDPSGRGEGKEYLTSVVTQPTDAQGNTTFFAVVDNDLVEIYPQGYVTATATDSGVDVIANTSEFSPCQQIAPAPPTSTPVVQFGTPTATPSFATPSTTAATATATRTASPTRTATRTAAPDDTCNAQLSVDYDFFPEPNMLGSIDVVTVRLGAGSIGGGSKLAVSEIVVDLDCRNRGCGMNPHANCLHDTDCSPGDFCNPLLPTCVDDGNVVRFMSEAPIQTNCTDLIGPIEWSFTLSGERPPNRVILTANRPVVIPEGQPAYCYVLFQTEMIAPQSNDTSPTTIEQVIGFGDAKCDNDLPASALVTTNLPLEPLPTATPTFTRSPSATATPSSSPTPTNTPGTAQLTLLTSSALSGGRACLAVSLAGRGQPITEVQTILQLPTGLTMETCSINPAIGPTSPANKEIVQGQIGVDVVIIRGGSATIPDGQLFACVVSVAPNSSPGARPIIHNTVAKNAQGASLPATATGAQVIVTACNGDCDGDGFVRIGEVVKALNAFGGAPVCDPGDVPRSCPVCDSDGDRSFEIGEVVQSLNRFSVGCP